MWNPEPRKYLLMGSRIQETFAHEIQNLGNICLWDPESKKHLLVGSGFLETFACGIQNLGNICSWDPESRKYFLVKSRTLLFGIRNPGKQTVWNQVHGICNPRLSQITLHWVNFSPSEFLKSRFIQGIFGLFWVFFSAFQGNFLKIIIYSSKHK